MVRSSDLLVPQSKGVEHPPFCSDSLKKATRFMKIKIHSARKALSLKFNPWNKIQKLLLLVLIIILLFISLLVCF